MAQVYATSIMFGYFVRRVDKRFQLERSLGLLNEQDTADAVNRLERLFAQVRALNFCAQSPITIKASKGCWTSWTRPRCKPPGAPVEGSGFCF